jgi:hypothetical protein
MLRRQSDGKLGRFALRQFLQRASGNGLQAAQRRVAFPRGLNEFPCDVFSGFMIAAIWQAAANILKNHVQICGRPFVEFRHGNKSGSAKFPQSMIKAFAGLRQVLGKSSKFVRLLARRPAMRGDRPARPLGLLFRSNIWNLTYSRTSNLCFRLCPPRPRKKTSL